MKRIALGLGLAMAVFLATSAGAAEAERYTCNNEAGWGTWKFYVYPVGGDPPDRPYDVHYNGYSVVTRSFGEWHGTGSWDRVNNVSRFSIPMARGTPYVATCLVDPNQGTRWTCADEELPMPNTFNIVCFPW